ncbi:alpha-amylase [Streptococcus hyointestinalis]|uniref:alpha-amylase n=1 Tax=Streptococcus hyointestinalis TaxID=1337 RepID=UPI003F9B1B4E
MTNETLLQGFEWYLKADGKHWLRLTEEAPHFAELGITKMWLPPAYKATSDHDVGYGIYDLFDLGEFDQKGTVRTKYGFKDEYLKLIQTLKENAISPIADVVLNHKASADALETFTVVEVDSEDRTKVLTEPFEIEGWTQFTFPGRNKTYNDFDWHWYHFTGTDYDARRNRSGIYQIQGDNKGWALGDLVDKENGNYDYLMYADLDFKHPEVVQNLRDWARWYIDTTGVEGFRLDAVKHIDSFFMNHFIRRIKERYGEDFYVFGEYWNGELEDNQHYLENIHFRFDLIDTRLHYNFFEAGLAGENYDLRQLFDETLVKHYPDKAVTFVENHDTQSGQALESVVADWFKPLAYATILLRKDGLPCVFYGDYHGVSGAHGQASFKDVLETLLRIRRDFAYGEQVDYFDDKNCIAWVRLGSETSAPIAVVLNNHQTTSKRMYVGKDYAGQSFSDEINPDSSQVLIDEDGFGEFSCPTRNVAVWCLIN